MKKNDWKLLIGILIAGSLLLAVMWITKEKGSYITITVDGSVYGSYELEKDREITISDTNTLLIKDGKAKMVYADCPDQLCMRQKEISANRESIVCLPNKIVAEVADSGNIETEYDAIVN